MVINETLPIQVKDLESLAHSNFANLKHNDLTYCDFFTHINEYLSLTAINSLKDFFVVYLKPYYIKKIENIKTKSAKMESIKVPARFLSCSHIDVFDFERYSEDPKESSVCPICNNTVNPLDIYIDKVIDEAIKENKGKDFLLIPRDINAKAKIRGYTQKELSETSNTKEKTEISDNSEIGKTVYFLRKLGAKDYIPYFEIKANKEIFESNANVLLILTTLSSVLSFMLILKIVLKRSTFLKVLKCNVSFFI